MNERDEINLRHAQQDWQAKQNSSGMVSMGLCAAAIGGFCYFVASPSSQSAGILAVLIVAVVVACARMVSCAAKVVEVRTSLRPVRVQSDIVDVEVVESPRRQEYQRLSQYI